MNVTASLMGDPPPGRSALERRVEPTRITLPVFKRDRKKKLTEDQVRFIRESDERSNVLAIRFNVSESAVDDVRYRRTWKHI